MKHSLKIQFNCCLSYEFRIPLNPELMFVNQDLLTTNLLIMD